MPADVKHKLEKNLLDILCRFKILYWFKKWTRYYVFLTKMHQMQHDLTFAWFVLPPMVVSETFGLYLITTILLQ